MPSIYLLVYDAYAPNETMLSYGINNRSQEEYLEDLGFTLYPRTYSVSASSLATMSRVLNVSDAFDGTRAAVAGGGVVQSLLHSYGYRTLGVFRSDYFFRGVDPNYDYSFPRVRISGLLLTDAILMGEFRFDAGFDEDPYVNYLAAKHQALSQQSAQPVFLYTHNKYPGHTQNSGRCIGDEMASYEDRLHVANHEMQKDLNLLLQNDPQAIIIIAGDHGPHVTKNCHMTTRAGFDISQITRQDIQDRYSAFLAIRWPTSTYQDFDDIRVLQDLFPAVFAYLFDDPSILDSRIEPTTLDAEWISGARVVDGVIQGGVNDGEPLFVGGE